MAEKFPRHNKYHDYVYYIYEYVVYSLITEELFTGLKDLSQKENYSVYTDDVNRCRKFWVVNANICFYFTTVIHYYTTICTRQKESM